MNRIDLEGQHAVVTGGAQGIGFAIAKRLIASGATATLWDLDETALTKAAGGLGKAARTIVVDIADPDAVLAAHARAARRKAARSPSPSIRRASPGPTASLDAYDVGWWKKIMDVNVNGTFYVNRAVVPGMKARNYGRIVNIASVAGKEGNPNASAYSASKAAVIGLTKSLGKELASFDIAVNCITPATAQTRILEQVAPEFIEYMRVRIPRGRFLEVDEAAAMVAWLVSKENSFTTASTFDLSGGRTTY